MSSEAESADASVTPGSGIRGRPYTHEDERDPNDTVPRAMMSLLKLDDPLSKQLVKRALFPRRTSPVQIGRFKVLNVVGRGGMGVVYACYDDLLDRKVAVKVLHSDVVRDPTLSRARLLREAQAMARLSHPHIVTVHEVGVDGEQVHVAMEFVRGRPLDAWAESRSWREVVAALVQAGRGLEAAHRAGLVHRDFKPQNVIVGEDGAVKVLDFGLARTGDDAPASESRAGLVSRIDPRASLTRTGTILGTPAYMSPEQHRGAPATAASDQFSFCVSLYQCLYGRPPFDTSSLPALLADLRRGRIAAPPAGSLVPARIYRALRRGLSLEPGSRFPDMTALLAAIERDPGATYRRVALLATTAIVTALAGFAAASASEAEIERCPDAAAELAGVWDDARATTVREVLTGMASPTAAELPTTLIPRIDAYARDWAAMRNEACEAHAEGRQSDQLFDLRTACLDQRRAGLDALVTALAAAEPAALDQLAEAAADLPPLERCADAQALTAAVAPPEEPRLRRRVQAHRETLARAQVHEDAGQYQLGRALVEAVLADEATLAYEPLRAEALLRAGSLALAAGDHEAADRSLTAAMLAGIAGDHDAVAAQASSKRAYVRAVPLYRAAEALADVPLATALNRRVHDDIDLRSEFLTNGGVVDAANGKLDAARQKWEEALRLRERAGRTEAPQALETLTNLGWLARAENRYEDMAAIYERAIAVSGPLLGPHHAAHVRYEWLLADAHFRLGRPRAALTRLRRLEQRFDRLENLPLRGMILHEIGLIELDEGELDAARAHFEQALAAIPEPSEHVDVVLCELIRLSAAEGDDAATRRYHQRALARLAEPLDLRDRRAQWLVHAHARALDVLGRTAEAIAPLTELHAAYAAAGAELESAEVSLLLAALQRKRGDLDAAESDLNSALDTLQLVAPPRSPTLAEAHLERGELALARRRFDAAADALTHAVSIYAALAEPDHTPLARARFARARALTADAPKATEAARSEATEALTAFRAKSRSTEADEVAAWLAQHG